MRRISSNSPFFWLWSSLPCSLRTASAGTPRLSGISYFSARSQVRVEAADIDVDDNKVGIDERFVFVVVHIKVENLAIAAPVAAKVEQDAAVRGCGGSEGGGKVTYRQSGIGIDVTTG
jgi:hypothetical protein